MRLRFFRRVFVIPGLRLNLSRSGPSLSFGRGGARLTVGPRGSRMTAGIPGTGLFLTERLPPGLATRSARADGRSLRAGRGDSAARRKGAGRYHKTPRKSIFD